MDCTLAGAGSTVQCGLFRLAGATFAAIAEYTHVGDFAFDGHFNTPGGAGARDAGRGGGPATQARTVDEFTRIHAEGASVIEVEVREGLARSVEVRTDEGQMSGVRTEVVAGVLEISPEAGFVSINDLHVKVTAPSLAAIHLEGANKMTLAIDSRQALELHTEGAGRIRATGRVDAVTVIGEGASAVDAGELIARAADVRIEGAGRATVHATEKLKARIEGVGVVRYAGNPPSVDKEVDGIGHISRAD